MPKTNRPIIHDIATKAKVSPATVDRVLNKRAGVREATAKLVLQAAVEVGYMPEADVFHTLQPRPMRIVFLLPAGTNRYLQLLGDTIKELGSSPAAANFKVQCFFIDSFNPQILSAALLKHGKKADGIAFMAVDHPLVRETVSQLTAQEKPVITIVSDMPNAGRAAYIGLDNRAVGRTAAYFLGRLLKPQAGKIALIAASRTYKTHEQRELGFLALMEEAFPQYQVVGVREGHDNRDENYRHATTLLEEYPNLVGIYNVGGSSDGIARALKEKKREKEVLFIGHGLTPDTRRFLIEEIMDMVIDQSPEAIVNNALQIFDNIRHDNHPHAGVPNLGMEIIVRENLP